jgi:serine phosphatase RsbU (regulator of sigma subunit)
MFIASFKLAVSSPHPGLALQQALFDNLERSSMFATVAGVRLCANGELHYFNLGHPPIFIVCSGKVEALRATAPPMGTFPLSDITLQTRQLHPGDLICLYSDGVSEAKRFEGDTFSSFLNLSASSRQSLLR